MATVTKNITKGIVRSFPLIYCISKTLTSSQIHSIAEMMLIIRPTKVCIGSKLSGNSFLELLLLTTFLFSKFLANILKSMNDRKKMSVAEMILIISPTKVFVQSKLLDISLLEYLPLKGKNQTR